MKKRIAAAVIGLALALPLTMTSQASAQKQPRHSTYLYCTIPSYRYNKSYIALRTWVYGYENGPQPLQLWVRDNGRGFYYWNDPNSVLPHYHAIYMPEDGYNYLTLIAYDRNTKDWCSASVVIYG